MLHAIHKIREKRGETLAEVLASTLIIALALLLLASMVAASSNLVRKSEATFESNMAEKNIIENGDALGDEGEPKVTKAQKTIKISQGSLKNVEPVNGTSSDQTIGFSINFNTVGLNENVTTYTVDGFTWKYSRAYE